jgi:hypothetical protein
MDGFPPAGCIARRLLDILRVSPRQQLSCPYASPFAHHVTFMQSVHASKRQLKEFLLNYIVQNNKNPKPFVWTKGPDKLQRIIEATKEYQAAHPRKLRKWRRKGHSIKN